MQKQTSRTGALSAVVVATLLLASVFGLQTAHATITSTLDLGSQGSQVTELQTYLASDVNLYPSGLVTGYFGSLTQTGVKKFQVAQGIVTSGTPSTTGYGRVGPQTMVRLNSVMSGGVVGDPTTWDAVPVLSTPSVSVTNTSATFTWFTNENTQGQVFYSTSPLQANEASAPMQQPYVSGSLAYDSGLTTAHNLTVPNLQPNTTYYFLTRGIDSSGNVSMTWPSTFHTNQ